MGGLEGRHQGRRRHHFYREGRPQVGSLWIQGALRERQGYQSEEVISAGFEITANTLPERGLFEWVRQRTDAIGYRTYLPNHREDEPFTP